MKQYQFILPMAVRDYECDVEGIVNNANYLHYMEHTRHQFLLSRGVSFIELHQRGVDTVVARISVQYKIPLTSDTEFLSCINVEKDGLKYVFLQDIYRKKDMKLSMRARVEAVTIINGSLGECEELSCLLD